MEVSVPAMPGPLSSSEIEEIIARAAECFGTPYEVRPTEVYNGPPFVDDKDRPLLFVTSTSAIVTEEDAAAEIAALQRPEYTRCLAEMTAEKIAAELEETGVVTTGSGGDTSAGIVSAGVAPALSVRSAPPPSGATAPAEAVLAARSSNGVSVEILSAQLVPPPPGATAGIEMVFGISGPAGVLECHIYRASVVDRRVDTTVAVQRFGGPPDQALINRLVEQLVRKVSNQ